jgi:hypothetical protein
MNRNPSSASFGLRAALVCLAAAIAGSGCATVAPQERAVLADPTMQFDADAKHDAALRHAIENREGSMGGTGVSGGGCGCN